MTRISPEWHTLTIRFATSEPAERFNFGDGRRVAEAVAHAIRESLGVEVVSVDDVIVTSSPRWHTTPVNQDVLLAIADEVAHYGEHT